jgi:hypothetical protein
MIQRISSGFLCLTAPALLAGALELSACGGGSSQSATSAEAATTATSSAPATSTAATPTSAASTPDAATFSRSLRLRDALERIIDQGVAELAFSDRRQVCGSCCL